MVDHKLDYLDKLRDPRWQKLKNGVLERDKYTCQKCGDRRSNLQVHHLYYLGEPWDVPAYALLTLCDACHQKEPAWRDVKQRLYDIYTQMLAAGFSIEDMEYHALCQLEDRLSGEGYGLAVRARSIERVTEEDARSQTAFFWQIINSVQRLLAAKELKLVMEHLAGITMELADDDHITVSRTPSLAVIGKTLDEWKPMVKRLKAELLKLLKMEPRRNEPMDSPARSRVPQSQRLSHESSSQPTQDYSEGLVQ